MIDSMTNTPTEIPQFDLADRLRKALRHSDTSVAEMAEYLEMSRGTIGMWIRGETQPKRAIVRLWALKTGVSYEWLLGEGPGWTTADAWPAMLPGKPA